MTEAEWLGADSPPAMLGWLCGGRGPSGLYVRHAPVSDRKLRLFACACCRAVWHLLRDDASRRAVEASERHADGWMSAGECARVAGAAQGSGAASGLAWQCCWPGAEECAWNAAHRLRRDGRLPRVDAAALLRDVVGNPLSRPRHRRACGTCAGKGEWLGSRPCVVCAGRGWSYADGLDPALLGCARCNGVALDDHGCPCRFGPLREAGPVARAAYDERLLGGALDPARLAVLADALEDAGCPEEPAPRHLRSPGPHYRGCWALDLVLGLS